jgi:2-hydroxychromene-2-carboxylate isomerase
MSRVDFYFDYLSPFAYLASRELAETLRRADAQAVFRPILLPAVLDHWGQRGPAEIPPKAVHTFKECLRYALLHDVPLRSPRLHPFNPLLGLRVTLAASSDAERECVTHALFALGWERGGDLSARDEIEAALSQARLPASQLLERAGSDEIKQRLRNETASAIERGVFGVPSLVAGDELFWGLSQLPNLELYLTGRDPLAQVDWEQLRAQGVGAQRPAVK